MILRRRNRKPPVPTPADAAPLFDPRRGVVLAQADAERKATRERIDTLAELLQPKLCNPFFDTFDKGDFD